MWIPSDHSTVLEPSPVWHIAFNTADLLSLEQFRLCIEGFVLSPGEVLPGRVWLSEQFEWIADATAESESYCLRSTYQNESDRLQVIRVAEDGIERTIVVGQVFEFEVHRDSYLDIYTYEIAMMILSDRILCR
jgi:Domain of unknown function (DUF1830)